MKPLSRKPFLLMLQDDAGELSHIKLDPNLVSSNNAIIVLDEYSDTCWVWIGRDVNMPTRMHALRMSKSLQKSGYSVGATTIGMSLSHLKEMMEKNESDPDVASSITSFRELLSRKWSFDDNILAFDSSRAGEYEAKPPEILDSMSSTPSTPVTSTSTTEIEVVAETVEPEPAKTSVLKVTTPNINAEKKISYLLYSTVKNADIVYVERIEKGDNSGFRIEAPGILVLEAMFKGNGVSISPANFGDSKQASEIKRTYEAWLNRI